MSISISISKHAKERMAQRMEGTNLKHLAEEAWQKGLRRDETTLQIREYMERIAARSTGTEPILYDGYVYMFRDGVLTTVFPIRPWLRMSAEWQQRQKEEHHG